MRKLASIGFVREDAPIGHNEWKRIGSLLYDDDKHQACVHLLMWHIGRLYARTDAGPFLQGEIVFPLSPNLKQPGLVWKGYVGYITSTDRGDDVLYSLQIECIPAISTRAGGIYLEVNLEDVDGYAPHNDALEIEAVEHEQKSITEGTEEQSGQAMGGIGA